MDDPKRPQTSAAEPPDSPPVAAEETERQHTHRDHPADPQRTPQAWWERLIVAMDPAVWSDGRDLRDPLPPSGGRPR